VVDRRDTLFFRTHFWMFPCAVLLVAAALLVRRGEDDARQASSAATALAKS
jgi:hypothetical protein